MVSAVAVTPNNRYIIGGVADGSVSGNIAFWDFITGSLVRVDKWKHSYLEFILATPDNRSIVVSGRDDNYFRDGMHYVVAGDIETANYQIIRAAKNFPFDLSFSWDKRFVKFGDYLWDWQKGEKPFAKGEKIKYDGYLHPKVFELTQDYVVTSDHESYIIKDIKTNQVLRRLDVGHNNRYHEQTSFKITADNRYLFAPRGHQFLTQDEILCMWDLETGALMKFFESCRGRIHSIDITSDNQFIVAAIGFDPSSTIIVVDVQADEVVLKIEHEIFHK
jgi:WD40 repeat protein